MTSITINNSGDGSFENPFKKIPKWKPNNKKRKKNSYYLNKSGKMLFWKGPNGKMKKDTKIFVKEAKEIHGDKFDYSLVDYVDCKIKVRIICKYHGEFLQTPDSHLQGHDGCYDCAMIQRIKTKTYDNEIFIRKAKEVHGEKYDYSLVEYIDYITKIIIICSRHGPFPQTPDCHLQGSGCPKCYNKTEGKLHIWLNIYYPNLITPQFSPEWIGLCKYDFLIKDIKLIIELDGEQHFKNVKHWKGDENSYIEQQDSDVYKMKKANEKGYSVIRLLTKDVRKDKNNWEERLLAAIKPYDTPTNIFICSNNEYEHHKRLL